MNSRQNQSRVIGSTILVFLLAIMVGVAGIKAVSAQVSDADTSVMRNALADGLNPHTTLLSTVFYCYGKEPGADPEKPLGTMKTQFDWVEMKFNGDRAIGRFKLDDEGGVVFSAQGEEMSANIEVTEFGQTIIPYGRGLTITGCYQEGAANDAALHQIRLNTPEQDEYQCRFSGGEKHIEFTLHFLSSSKYRVNRKTGTYSLSTSAEDSGSEIVFNSGELEGIEGFYSEQPVSGVQTLSADITKSKSYAFGASQSSSSKTAGACTRQRKPRPLAQYGKALAPKTPKPAKSIEAGWYILDDTELSSRRKHSYAAYLKFTSYGRVYAGVPENGDVDCTRTQPSGLPVCNRYEFDGKTLKLFIGDVLLGSSRASTDSNGILVKVDGKKPELLKPISVSQLIGGWKSEIVDAGDVNMCIIGFCSGSIENMTIQFREDGKFLSNQETESYSSASLDTLATFAKGASEEEGSGTYHVENGMVTLTFYNGEIITTIAAVTPRGTLAFGGMQYEKAGE